MKLYKITLLGILLSSAATGFAANLVEVASKVVAPGSTGNTVEVRISNEVAIEGLALPLEIRNVSGAGFITGNLSITPLNRLENALTGYIIDTTLPLDDNTTWYKCEGGGFKTRGAPDFLSPDGLLFAAVNAIGGYPLESGLEGIGYGSIIIAFDASHEEGVFVIDTTCVTPDNHLAFYSSGRELITPAFTPGIIEVCHCVCWSDPVCNGVRSNVSDVVAVVNVAFRGAAPHTDPNCTLEREDVNASGFVNVQDVVAVVNVAFRGGTVATYYNDPCD